MKAFLALLKLELSGWKNAFSLNTGKNTKNDKKLSRTLVMVLMLVIVAGYLAFVEWNALDFLISVGAQDLLLKMVVALSMVMTLLMGVFQVMSSLYFSKDIAILSYLPADERVIYAARMAGQWIEEILISALMIVPCVGVYMYRLGFSLPLLLRCIAVTVLSPVLPLCVSALISWLLTQLSAFWRHRETVITALSTVFIVAYIAMSFFMGQAGGRASDQEGFATLISAIRPAVERLTDSVPPVRYAANALAYGGIDMLWTALLAFGSLAIVILLCGRGYVRCAARGLENEASGKKISLEKANLAANSPLKALVSREISEMIRTPAYFTNGVLISIVMPTLMIGLILISLSTTVEGGIGAILSNLQNDGVPMVLITGFLTIMMSLMLGMNSAASTAITREGHRHGLMMSLPTDAKTIVRSKLIMGLFFSWIGLVLPCVLCAIVIPGFAPYACLCLLWSMLLGYFGTCVGLVIDITRPKMDWLNETQAIKSNVNQIFSLLLYMAVLGALIGLSIFAIFQGMNLTLYAVALTGVLLLLCALSRLWLSKKTPAYSAIDA